MGKVLITPTKRKIRGIPPGATLQVTAREAKWLVKHRLAELVDPAPLDAAVLPAVEPEPPRLRPRSTRKRNKVDEPEAEDAAGASVLDAPHAADDPDYVVPDEPPKRTYRRRDLTAEE